MAREKQPMSHHRDTMCQTKNRIPRYGLDCFDKKNGPGGPFLSNTMDIRHLTKMDPPYFSHVSDIFQAFI